MLRAVAEYLKGLGWRVLVIGGDRIQKVPGAFAYNHEFVIRFTGHQLPEQSKCCNAPVKVNGDDREGTRYYVCTCCGISCDLRSPS
jgi:hypothetical protein